MEEKNILAKDKYPPHGFILQKDVIIIDKIKLIVITIFYHN